jgi:hypothetical protein
MHVDDSVIVQTSGGLPTEFRQPRKEKSAGRKTLPIQSTIALSNVLRR